MNRFISFSGGVESSAMCVLFGKGATAIFADTGLEHDKMYERLDHMEKMLMEHHDGDFNLVRLRASVKINGVEVDNLLDYMMEAKFLPTPFARYCTRIFKIQVIDNYLASFDNVELMIGLNAEEAESRTGNHGLGKGIKYTYPLVVSDMDRGDCKDLLNHYGLMPDFPAYMSRGGCIMCPFKAKKEYRAMVHLAPEEIARVAEIEVAIQDSRGKHFTIRNDMPPMKEFIAIEKQNLFGNLSQHYEAPEKKSCGVFCHR
jgi:3'-phosphoadenosine 5'-phosphosulfate sulfotransferase (PAPS reductase)/FAD synthetase